MAAMRGNQGRCPPFLVAGLAVFCFVLMYNYWSVSSQNYDLFLEVEELQSKIKFLSNKQIQLESDGKLLKSRLEETDDKIGKYQVELHTAREQLRKEKGIVSTLKNDNENLQQETRNCREEAKRLEALTNTNDEDKVKFDAQKEKLQKDVDKYEKTLKDAQKKEEDYQKTIKQLRNEIQQLQNEVQSSPFSPAADKLHRSSSSTISASLKQAVSIHPKATDGMMYHSTPIIVFEAPDTPKATARFSVADIESGKITTPKSVKTSTTSSSSVVGAKPAGVDNLNEEDRENEHKNALGNKPAPVLEAPSKESAKQNKIGIVISKPVAANLDAQEDDANADGMANVNDDQPADGTLDEQHPKPKTKSDNNNKDELHLDPPAKQDPIDGLAENLVKQQE